MSLDALTIARKELADHSRDGRALAATALYALMGPLTVGIVLAALNGKGGAPGPSPLPALAAAFALVAAFTSSMSVSMDMIAGERERRSLLPLLMNPVSRLDITLGKWLAASVFGVAGLVVTLAAFAVLFAPSPSSLEGLGLLALAPAVLALPFAAAGLQMVLSTLCRNIKEANTYLSMLVFILVGGSMWLAFNPQAAEQAWALVPVAGQQIQLQAGLANRAVSLTDAAALAVATAVVAALAVASAATLLGRDAIVYGH